MTPRRILLVCGVVALALLAIAPQLSRTPETVRAQGANLGTLSGQAWSDTIGWINFGANSCGTPQISGTSVTGSAKATVADGNGWDGCILLNPGAPATTPVTLPGGTGASGPFSGQAWGNEVVSWLNFSPAGYPAVTFVAAAAPPPPTFSLSVTANPTKVRKTTGITTLTWVGSLLPATCQLSRNPTVAGYPQTVNSTPTGNIVGDGAADVTATNITQSTTFTVDCGGGNSGQATVGVDASFIEI